MSKLWYETSIQLGESCDWQPQVEDVVMGSDNRLYLVYGLDSGQKVYFDLYETDENNNLIELKYPGLKAQIIRNRGLLDQESEYRLQGTYEA